MFTQKKFISNCLTRKCILTRTTLRGKKIYSVGYYGEYSNVNNLKSEEVVDFTKLKNAKYSIERFLDTTRY